MKKFSHKFTAWYWKSKNEFILHQSLALKRRKAYGETCDVISRKYLKELGVDLAFNDIFWLEINGVKYEFHPWNKEFYRNVNGLTEFKISTTTAPNCTISPVDIYVVKQNGCKYGITLTQPKCDIKLKSHNGYDWMMNGRGAMLGNISLIESGEDRGNIGSQIKWITL